MLYFIFLEKLIDNFRATSFTIQLGSNQLSGTDPNRLTVTASKYFINDRFDPTVSLAHDMAVIKLNEPINFTGTFT